MNNKELLRRVAEKTGLDMKDVDIMKDALVKHLVDQITVGNTVAFTGFGSFEPKIRASRRIYNPSNQQFRVVPQKTTVAFKPSLVLKDKINKK